MFNQTRNVILNNLCNQTIGDKFDKSKEKQLRYTAKVFKLLVVVRKMKKEYFAGGKL